MKAAVGVIKGRGACAETFSFPLLLTVGLRGSEQHLEFLLGMENRFE